MPAVLEIFLSQTVDSGSQNFSITGKEIKRTTKSSGS
tara:strand:+ start:56 stop:166 length:111 start_codon:yes stop_codon:yes gene_type:complete